MNTPLREQWLLLAGKYTKERELTEDLWKELQEAYTAPSRHYHNLDHIENMLRFLQGHYALLEQPDEVRLAVWFHDVVYNTYRSDNEERSAVKAKKALKRLGTGESVQLRVMQLILLTKTHPLQPGDNDASLLLDADLSVLGAEWSEYEAYSRGVRLEYGQYPELMYRPGRSRVIKDFLNAPYIYRTKEVRVLLEEQARKNLTRELQLLNL